MFTPSKYFAAIAHAVMGMKNAGHNLRFGGTGPSAPGHGVERARKRLAARREEQAHIPMGGKYTRQQARAEFRQEMKARRTGRKIHAMRSFVQGGSASV